MINETYKVWKERHEILFRWYTYQYWKLKSMGKLLNWIKYLWSLSKYKSNMWKSIMCPSNGNIQLGNAFILKFKGAQFIASFFPAWVLNQTKEEAERGRNTAINNVDFEKCGLYLYIREIHNAGFQN